MYPYYLCLNLIIIIRVLWFIIWKHRKHYTTWLDWLHNCILPLPSHSVAFVLSLSPRLLLQIRTLNPRRAYNSHPPAVLKARFCITPSRLMPFRQPQPAKCQLPHVLHSLKWWERWQTFPKVACSLMDSRQLLQVAPSLGFHPFCKGFLRMLPGAGMAPLQPTPSQRLRPVAHQETVSLCFKCAQTKERSGRRKSNNLVFSLSDHAPVLIAKTRYPISLCEPCVCLYVYSY